jgi:HSP20 family protein
MFDLQFARPSALRGMRGEIQRAFEGLFDPSWGLDSGGVPGATPYPPMNVWEDAGAVTAVVEIPGLSLEDIEVLMVGRELTVKGERKETSGQDTAYHRRERPIGVFSRTLRLPVDVDAGKVQASLKDGILTIAMPKAEAAKPRKIEVKGA